MKMWRRIPALCALVLLIVGPWSTALGAEISGRSSTVFEWFDDAEEDTALVGYQYLRLNVSDIADGYRFAGYGRLAEDFADELEIDNRLYYAYIEKTNLVPDLDLRLGRQFISTTAGASVMDGVNVDWHNVGPVDIRLFGGGDVTYYEGYNADDIIVGTEVETTLFDMADLGLSYLQKWDDNELGQELIGFDANLRFDQNFSLYNETQYSWLTDEITYALTGVKAEPFENATARVEYLYSLPVFSSTSIYSVFAANEYQEVMGEMTYRLSRGLRAFGNYTREIYEDFADADVFEAGIEKLRTERFSGYLAFTLREGNDDGDDDGQDLYGGKAYGSYRFTEMFDAGLGAHIDYLDRRIEIEDQTTSTRLWVDGTAYVNNMTNLQAKVEYIESDLWDEYYRGRIRLNILF